MGRRESRRVMSAVIANSHSSSVSEVLLLEVSVAVGVTAAVEEGVVLFVEIEELMAKLREKIDCGG